MFVQGGLVYPGDNLYVAGGGGYYWSSVGRSSGDAYNLNFNSGNVYPSAGYYRYDGFPVRCVALGD